MGMQMGCKIIAEGVQTKDHITFLRQEGCQSMQGYLIGKPCSNERLLSKMSQGTDDDDAARSRLTA